MPRRTWRSPDGNLWVVEVDLPGSSNAMVLFYEPGGKSGQMDRYAWYISNGPESRSVTSRLTKAKVLESLTDEDLERLYRRSMKVSRPDAIIGEAKLL